jgi:hypothetical protein
MATNPKSPAEAQALKARRDADGKKAMAEYEASAEATRAKTERLRALRLARDAALPPVVAPVKGAKKTKSAKAKKEAPGKLSDWIKGQEDSGRNF